MQAVIALSSASMTAKLSSEPHAFDVIPSVEHYNSHITSSWQPQYIVVLTHGVRQLVTLAGTHAC